MRSWINLCEGKWWDDEPTITLYHGTSSALVSDIRTNGLKPPSDGLRDYALDILRLYVPEERWTPELLKMVEEHAIRPVGRGHGEFGPVLFFKTHKDGVEGYAHAYAEDGGEIAMDVRRCAVLFDKGEMPWRDAMGEFKQFPARFAGAKPVIVTVEIPKSWCMFMKDPAEIKADIDDARAQGKEWAEGPIEDVYDEVFEDREVRVGRTIPPSMIVSIDEV